MFEAAPSASLAKAEPASEGGGLHGAEDAGAAAASAGSPTWTPASNVPAQAEEATAGVGGLPGERTPTAAVVLSPSQEAEGSPAGAAAERAAASPAGVEGHSSRGPGSPAAKSEAMQLEQQAPAATGDLPEAEGAQAEQAAIGASAEGVDAEDAEGVAPLPERAQGREARIAPGGAEQ